MSGASIDWASRAEALEPRILDFIDGCAQDAAYPAESIEKYAPRDGKLLYQVGAGDRRRVDEAVSSARGAFEDGRWSRLSTQHRKTVLLRLAALIEAHRDEFALLECLDVGKPISDALSIDVPMAAGALRFSAEAADKFYGKVYAVDASSLAYQLRRPMGVVAAIIGWNFPLVLATQKIGPALATGNSLVLKPSELTSLSATRVAQLALEAGVPPGVLNVVNGGAAAGADLAHHPHVSLLTFTGSTLTGKKLLAASGQSNMKRLILECGGKAPNIVFEDAPDLCAVADAIVARAFWNQGQVCTASSRLLVEASVKEELLRLVIERVAALRPEDPLQIATRFGAVVSSKHREKILEYIASAKSEGASVVYESAAPAPFAQGFYVTPTIFDGVTPQQRIAREEIFGPVLCVMTFRDEEEAARIANDTIYGLSGILWTKDLGRAHRITHAIHAGWITVNAAARPRGGAGEGVLSLGGHKQSGMGIEGGIEGLEGYTSSTAVQIFV